MSKAGEDIFKLQLQQYWVRMAELKYANAEIYIHRRGFESRESISVFIPISHHFV